MRVDTNLVKSPMGVVDTQLREKMLPADDSVLLSGDSALHSGDSSIIQKQNAEEERGGKNVSTGEQSGSYDQEATVMEEGEDTSRWSEIIDALKSGGFGS